MKKQFLSWTISACVASLSLLLPATVAGQQKPKLAEQQQALRHGQALPLQRRTMAKMAAFAETIRVPQHEVYSTWDDGKWLDEVATDYTYNSMGLWQTSVAQELTDPMTQAQTAYAYDAEGRLTSYTVQSRDNSSSAWENALKVTLAYENDLLTSLEFYGWENNAWALFLGSHISYTRSNGRVTQSVTQTFMATEEEAGAWENSEKTEYTYSGSDDRPATITTFEWIENAWLETMRQTNIVYTGDTNNWASYDLRETTYLQGNSIATLSKHAFSYTTDATTQTTVETVSQVNPATQAATLYSRTTTTVLVSGENYLAQNLVASKEETYNTATSMWEQTSAQRADITRNSTNDITQIVYQEYADATQNFVNTEKFTFSDFISLTVTGTEDEVLAAATTVYPNPVQQDLRVSLDDLQVRDASLSVYSMTGQKVYELARLGQSATVDMSKLPSGVYMVRLTTNGNATVTRKVVKL